MPVDPLNPALAYTINASNEAGENLRQRDERKRSQQIKKDPTKEDKALNGSVSDPPLTEEPKVEKEATELTGQIIDSQKVIELLARQPKYRGALKNLFRQRPSSPSDPQNSDIKKFNKAV